MNKVVYEACLAVFLLILGICCCWSERWFFRTGEELDRRLFGLDWREWKSYQSLVVKKKVI